MFFFILQSLFWFLLALFSGYFLGRWLKRFLCNCKVSVDNTTEIIRPANTTPLKSPITTKIKPETAPLSNDSSYDAMINKLSSKDKKTTPQSNLNVANVSTGAAAATLGAAAYAALKATSKDKDNNEKPSTHIDGIDKPSSLAFDSQKSTPRIDTGNTIKTTDDLPDETSNKTLGERLKDSKAS